MDDKEKDHLHRACVRTFLRSVMPLYSELKLQHHYSEGLSQARFLYNLVLSTDVSSVSPSSERFAPTICSDEGLTLETSAFESLCLANSHYQLS